MMDLKKLAKELNLSFSTVSKAPHDSHEISAATKRRVIAKAKEFNYQVNLLASSFRKQKSKTIALVIPEVVNDLFGPVINGIESVAHEKGYHFLIYMTHENLQKEISIFKLLQNGRVDGIMFSVSEQSSDITHIKELKKNGIPLMLFDRVIEQLHVNTVTTDNFAGGVLATEHLIEKGCKEIAFLSISKRASVSLGRMNGYKEALSRNAITHQEDMFIYCDGNDIYNRTLVRALPTRKNRPDRIFASVETLAILAYEVCNELRLIIPEHIKIIAVSSSYMAALLNPPLTAIVQPAYEMGKEAASMLINLVGKKGFYFKNQNTEIKSKLVMRESTK